MIQSLFRVFRQRNGFSRQQLDHWRAASGMIRGADLARLRRRKRWFAFWNFARLVVRLLITIFKSVGNLFLFPAELAHLHAGRNVLVGRGCVLDRQTWLVNGFSLESANFVNVSAYSSLVACNEAKIRIGDNTVLEPDVVVIAANRGSAMNGIPIRFQLREGKSVEIDAGVRAIPTSSSCLAPTLKTARWSELEL